MRTGMLLSPMPEIEDLPLATHAINGVEINVGIQPLRLIHVAQGQHTAIREAAIRRAEDTGGTHVHIHGR